MYPRSVKIEESINSIGSQGNTENTENTENTDKMVTDGTMKVDSASIAALNNKTDNLLSTKTTSVQTHQKS